MSVPIAFLGSAQDWLVVLGLGFVLFVVFGNRLPEVLKSLGKGIKEFQNGMKGLEHDTVEVVRAPAAAQSQPLPAVSQPPQRITAPAPKFDETPSSSATVVG